jgi:CRP/FNR family transcriptional regulator, cyclic AMP receptor protein
MEVGAAVRLLARCEALHGIGDPALRYLAERAHSRCYRRGAFVFVEGDPGDALHVIVNGRVRVVVSSGRGEELVLAMLGPSEAICELAAFDGLPRPVSAEVVEPTNALILPSNALEQVIRTDGGAAAAMLASAAMRLRHTISQSADLAFLDLEGRVAKLLVDAGERHGRPAGKGVEIELAISRSDIGRMLGGSRDAVNRVFRSLESRRLIRTSGHTVLLPVPQALRRRAIVH